MTNEELQKLLTSFEQEVGNIKQWEIDRKDNLKAVCKDGGKVGGKTHIQNKTGLFSRTKEEIKNHASKGGKIGGKIVGAMMRDNGHLAKICGLGGKKGGKTNVESGHLAKVRVNGGKNASEKIYICPHCNKELKGAIYFRWHGDNCKHKTT